MTIDANVHPMLVSDMAKLRDGLLPVIRRQLEMSEVAAEGIRISLKSNLEEDWNEVVFRIQVQASSEQALAFWDSIGEAVAEWRSTLSKRAQKLLDEKVGVFVEWPGSLRLT
ncbi:MAG: hypothetical protein L0177_02760 [Chloroflexi bacterium]|nr:hypothetical protein [Chloroflexota bacterium]